MSKEEKIKESYGEYYSKCKPDQNGWTTYDSWFKYIGNKIDYDYSDNRVMNVRPKIISGIEKNNGWKKLSEIKDEEKEQTFNQLPQTNRYYDIVVNGKIEYRYYYGGCISSDRYVENNVTHFRLSPTHELPIH